MNLGNWGVAAVAGLLTVGLAEVGLRAIAPVSLDPPMPTSGAMRVELRQELPGLQERIVYERNGYGLRTSATIPGPKPSGATRILCLGASTTDQATQNLTATWCERLGEALEAENGGLFETASFGRGGYRAVDLLAWAEDSVAAIEPDVVVLLLGINDLAFAGGPGYRYPGLDSTLARSRRLRDPRLRQADEGSWGRRLCPPAFQICRRLILLKRGLRDSGGEGTSIEWHSANLPRLREEYRRLPLSDRPSRDPDPAHEFRDAVDSLVATLSARGIRTVLLGQPTLWSSEMSDVEQAALWFGISTPQGKVRAPGAWLDGEVKRYNGLQEEVARAREMTYFDLGDRVPKSLEYFFDDCHFTDLASGLVARDLAPVVAAAIRR